MKVKICGITNYKDAAFSVDQGVDALGFNFYRLSPRYIDATTARSIIGRLPPFVTTVGVFVNLSGPEQVAEAARSAGVQVIQLHGDESPEFCRKLGDWFLIKALRIGKHPIRENLEEYPVQAFLLDTKSDVLYGGTGVSFEWNLAHGIKRIRPVILAGGLRPDNVGEAIRLVQPYAVDICSGVESSPGKKDFAKLIEFMNEVRNASSSF